MLAPLTQIVISLQFLHLEPPIPTDERASLEQRLQGHCPSHFRVPYRVALDPLHVADILLPAALTLAQLADRCAHVQVSAPIIVGFPRHNVALPITAMCQLHTLHTAHLVVKTLLNVMIDRSIDGLPLGSSMAAALGTYSVIVIDIVKLFGETRAFDRLVEDEGGDAETQRARSKSDLQAAHCSEFDSLPTDCSFSSCAQCSVVYACLLVWVSDGMIDAVTCEQSNVKPNSKSETKSILVVPEY